MNEYLAGEKLFGDDFCIEELEKWYEAEKEGYADKVREREKKKGYEYSYHQLNIQNGFRHLPDQVDFKHVLGFGSAYGDEFLPISDRISKLTVVEPSDLFEGPTKLGIEATYVKPDVSGDLSFEDASFDLIVCLGVLHHIPNVSHVMGEISRCLLPGGCALIREPICSQGDWSKKRANLTKYERGIPKQIFREIIDQSGLNIVQETFCVFRPLAKVWSLVFETSPWNSSVAVSLDRIVSGMFLWNWSYHPVNTFKKFIPVSAYYVLKK